MIIRNIPVNTGNCCCDCCHGPKPELLPRLEFPKPVDLSPDQKEFLEKLLEGYGKGLHKQAQLKLEVPRYFREPECKPVPMPMPIIPERGGQGRESCPCFPGWEYPIFLYGRDDVHSYDSRMLIEKSSSAMNGGIILY